MMPDCRASTVFLPITWCGRVSSTLSSWAARRVSASTEISMPGASAPPTNSPLRADRVEVGGGAEVHHDGRAAVQVHRGHRVHDPVAAHFLGVVHPDRHPGAHPGLDDQRGDVAVVPAAHLPHLVQHRRHRGAQRDPAHVRVLDQRAVLEQAAQQRRRSRRRSGPGRCRSASARRSGRRRTCPARCWCCRRQWSAAWHSRLSGVLSISRVAPTRAATRSRAGPA